MRKSQKENLFGRTFLRLVVIGSAPSTEDGHARWLVRCDCGSELVVRATSLKQGNTQSCGCYFLERITEANTTHGDVGSSEYMTHQGILGRCYDRADASYHRYGGRGIVVCQRWLGDGGYVRFLADMGRRPTPDMTIERKDNNAGYGPDNCVWADRIVQANNRRSNRMVVWDGKEMTLANACRSAGVRYGTVVQRLNVYGWPLDRAMMAGGQV